MCSVCRCVGRAELWGRGSKQLKISPGGGFIYRRGCKLFYILFGWVGGDSGQPGNRSGYTLGVHATA